jgi:hypothetical protein
LAAATEHRSISIGAVMNAEVEFYLAVMDQLSGEALTPAATVRFIEQAAREA